MRSGLLSSSWSSTSTVTTVLGGCESSWTMEAFIEEEVARVRERVGSRNVVCGLSGGVDSSVAAALVPRVS